MNLDINTPKGKKSLEGEREAIEKFEKGNPGYHYAETPKDEPASIDGIIHREGVIRAIVEVKVRNMTRQKLTSYADKWLITASKVERGKQISKHLRVPFMGFLYLIPERRLFILPVTDSQGEYLFQFQTKESHTQKTCNGGVVVRLNAYLPMDSAREQK